MCLPEYTAATAVFEWSLAQQSVKDMRDYLGDDWTMTHAFFANAGGFILEYEDPDWPSIPHEPGSQPQPAMTSLGSVGPSISSSSNLRSEGLELPRPRYPKRFPITAEVIKVLLRRGFKLSRISPRKEEDVINDSVGDEIKDKSKQDWFAKTIALLQTFRFIACCVARLLDPLGLTITPLEFITGRVVLFSFVTVFFQWKKPQGVNTPIVTQCRLPNHDEDLFKELGEVYSSYFGRVPDDFRTITRIPNGYYPLLQFPVHFAAVTGFCFGFAATSFGSNTGSFYMVSHLGLGAPWSFAWRYTAIVAMPISLIVLLEILTKNLLRKENRISRQLGKLGIALGVVYALCRLSFYVIGITTLIIGHLPLSSYRVAEWTDYIPGLRF